MQILASAFIALSMVIGSLFVHPSVNLGANSTISNLTAKTSPAGDDLLAIVDSSAVPPTTKKLTFANATSTFKTYNDTIYSPLAGSASLVTVGALTSGSLASGFTAVNVAQGGTGSTTLSQYHVLLGSSTNAIGIVSGSGSSGQSLVSNGTGVAPSWQSVSFDTTANYVNTGAWTFPAATGTPVTLNTQTYAFPSSRGVASSTFIDNGYGTLYQYRPDWMLLASTTLTAAVATTTLSGIATSTDLKVIIEAPANAAAGQMFLQFNNDTTPTNTSYAGSMLVFNGSAYGIPTFQQSSSSIVIARPNPSITDYYAVLQISNTLSKNKIVLTDCVNTAGIESSYTSRCSGSGLWVNTSQRISSISLACTSNCAIGTRISVYGSSQ